jgi:hypothetical protein
MLDLPTQRFDKLLRSIKLERDHVNDNVAIKVRDSYPKFPLSFLGLAIHTHLLDVLPGRMLPVRRRLAAADVYYLMSARNESWQEVSSHMPSAPMTTIRAMFSPQFLIKPFDSALGQVSNSGTSKGVIGLNYEVFAKTLPTLNTRPNEVLICRSMPGKRRESSGATSFVTASLRTACRYHVDVACCFGDHVDFFPERFESNEDRRYTIGRREWQIRYQRFKAEGKSDGKAIN